MKYSLKYFTFLLFIIGCSPDPENPDNSTFRNKHNNTFWFYDDILISFSPGKLFFQKSSDEDCIFFEEGIYNRVNYDGCTYDNVSHVIIEENEDVFIIREIVSSGTTNNSGTFCRGGETTIKFQKINDNVIETTISYKWGNDQSSSTYTLTKVNNSFTTNNCINGTLNNYQW